MPDNVVSLPLRGKVFLTGPNRTADSTATTSKAANGVIKIFKDFDYSGTNPVKLRRTGGEVTCILVRNSSGISLLPKRLVTWKSGKRGLEVDGYAASNVSDAVAGVVDEFLPSTGVANNDYFWLVVRGPTMAVTAAEADETNSIGVDVWLIAGTAAASTFSTSSGRVVPLVPPTAGLTTNITFAQSRLINKIGRAISAKTTSNTGADILIYVDLY